MKLFELEIGNIRILAAAESLEKMHKRKSEVDAQFAFLPVQITEVALDGYTITVSEDAEAPVKNRGGRPRKEA